MIHPSPSFQPLYLQIKGLLERSLENGEWRPAEAIPSEHDLARRFGVSQGTVRKAIQSLAADNLVVRRQGKCPSSRRAGGNAAPRRRPNYADFRRSARRMAPRSLRDAATSLLQPTGLTRRTNVTACRDESRYNGLLLCTMAIPPYKAQ